MTSRNKINFPKKDLPYFELDNDLDGVEEFENEVIVTIVSLSFDKNTKWRVTDGDRKYSVTISDKNFLNKVDKDKSFRKNDLLRVKMLTRQWKIDGRLKTTYEILKVLHHEPAPDTGSEQLEFDLGI